MRKLLHKRLSHEHAKYHSWSYDEEKGQKKRANIRPKYQPPTKKELL
jgi:hypothetical protein